MNSTLKMLGGLVLALGVIIPGAVFANTDGNDDIKVARGSATEVMITNGGRVLLGGAKVTAVSGSTITATTLWGGTTLSWTITTDGTTLFSNKAGNSILADVTVGDMVSVAGSLNAGSSLSLRATAVKDWSKGVETVNVSGTISSLNATNTSLVLTNKNGGTTSVQVTTATAITAHGASVGFATLVVGNTLKVAGSWNADHSVFSATKVLVEKKEAREDKRFGQVTKQWFQGHGFFGFRADR